MKSRAKKPKDSIDRLYAAVNVWLEKHGGKAVVIGGISIIQMPRELTFYVAIKVLGRKPVLKGHA